MKTINEIKVCYACRGCENSCKQNAISFVQNKYSGIAFPVIDPSLCIECSSCVLKCKKKHVGNTPKQTYVMETKNEYDLLSASSGGAFFEIARLFLDKYDGRVYGVEYDENLKVRHIGYNDERIKKFRKSKYVSSDISGIFSQIEDELKKGRFVLFSGTPCQIVGLKKYLFNEYENLFTIDLICTGVMCPSIYERFLQLYNPLQGKYFDWRYKHECVDGKWNIMDSAMVSDKGIIQDDEIIRIKRLYSKKIGYKDSCYQCEYATLNRYSDITLGDYWGDKSFFHNDPNKGTSAILINTEKGQKLFEKLDQSRILLSNISIEQIVEQNPALSRPSKRSEKNDAFWIDFKNKECNIKYLLKQYTKDKLSSRIKMAVARFIPKTVMNKICELKKILINILNAQS